MSSDLTLNPTGGSSVQNVPDYLDSPLFQSLSQHIQDTLTQSLSLEELNALFPSTPTLPSPTVSTNISISEYFQTNNSTQIGFQQSLQTGLRVDQETRRKANQAAAILAGFLVTQIDVRNNASNQAKSGTASERLAARNLLTNINSEVDDVNMLIKNLNTGNTTEQTQATNLINSYNNFASVLQSLGATQTIGGHYNIPPGATLEETQAKIDAYNQAAAEYAQAAAQFQTYWTSRVGAYDSLATAYNASAASNNQDVADLIANYPLSDFLTPAELAGLFQPLATLRSPNIFNAAPSPVTIFSLPTTISSGQPPDQFYQISQNGPPTFNSIFYHFNPQLLDKINQAILHDTYQQTVTILDVKLQQQMGTWAYLNMLNVFNPPQDTSADPLLNSKPVIRKLLPNTIVSNYQAIGGQSVRGAGTLAVQALGLGSEHTMALLGKAMLTESLNTTKRFNSQERLDDVSNQLLVLSAGLLGSNALAAFIPSLALLNNSLTSLPPNSPAFSALFSLSLVE